MTRASLGTSKVLYQMVPADLRVSDPRPLVVDPAPAAALASVRERFGAGSDIELMLFGENA